MSELRAVKGELVAHTAKRDQAETLQKAVDVYREETARAKSDAHLLKLELDKAKRVNDETSSDLAAIQAQH